MNKRFWLCAIVTGIAALVLNFLIHGLLLREDYAALVARGLVRGATDGMRHLPWMLLAHVLTGFGLTWLYSLVHPQATTPRNGLRFGSVMALTATIPGYLVFYALQPWPAQLLIKQIVLATTATLMLGLLLSWLEPRRVAL
ncbi:MAG: hypothetical protein Q4B94_00605 [Pseudomonadota bacterium]|nr:hypothetical protein [Pseudomonadota bacterium]